MQNTITVWSTPAISDDKILPDTLPPENPTTAMSVRACRGESVPLSFCVRASKPLVGLAAETQYIGKWSIDIRYVKCWWQSGDKSVVHQRPTFTPELLLHDPGLVTVDMGAQRNVIRKPVQDARQLQPIYLAADFTQQYWVTIAVPDDALTGKYTITVRLTSRGETVRELPIDIEVLPFELEQPTLEYAIYYRGKLRDTETPGFESEWKTPTQHGAELENMLQHGVTTPICYQGDDDRLEEAVGIWKDIGLNTETMYLCGRNNKTGQPNNEIKLLKLKIRMLERRIQLLPLGVQDVYFYGLDEATGPALVVQRAAWQAIHEAGGKVFVAGNTDLLANMGDLIDVAIVMRNCKDHIPAFHTHGAKVWLYSAPQTVPEYPATYRRSYGLQLLAEGWDGCCPYAYQHSMGETIWDDFDHARLRDHVMAYPTIDGVVDTIQWEGFHAGVIDVRYAATLGAAGGSVPAIDDRDLDEVRAEMIDTILSIS